MVLCIRSLTNLIASIVPGDKTSKNWFRSLYSNVISCRFVPTSLSKDVSREKLLCLNTRLIGIPNYVLTVLNCIESHENFAFFG